MFIEIQLIEESVGAFVLICELEHIDDDVAVDNNFRLAVSNLNTIDVLPQIGANVYDIMRKDKLILTVSAVKALEARLK